jgi:hypothetical protein
MAAAVNAYESDYLAFSCSALEHLCQSRSLKELGLWKFNFPEALDDNRSMVEPLLFMAPAIAESNSMRMFEFGKCHLSRGGDEAMAAMLQSNTSLQEVDLYLENPTTASDDVCHIAATAKALEATDRILKSLKLWGLLSRPNQKALVSMAQHNYTLQTCRLLDADDDISVLIEFYIGLNRRNRRMLLTRSVGISKWITFLLSVTAGKRI